MPSTVSLEAMVPASVVPSAAGPAIVLPAAPATFASAPTPAPAAAAPQSFATAAPSAAAATSVNGGGAAWSAVPPAPSSVRVLFVEDNIANQKLGKFMLVKRGFTVVTAADGVEAVDAVTADGRARRDAGMPPSGGAAGGGVAGRPAPPMRRVITLTTQRVNSFDNLAVAGGDGAGGGGGSGGGGAASTGSTGDAAAARGGGSAGRHRTQSLMTITTTDISAGNTATTSTTSVLQDALPPAPGVLGAASLPSPSSAPVDTTLSPAHAHHSNGGPASSLPSGAATVGAEPSAFDAAYSGFNIILMDLSLPRCGGIQATQLLRAAGYAGRILALTASDSEQQERACVEAGMDGLLRKPFRAEELAHAVMEQHKLTHADPPMQRIGHYGRTHSPASSERTLQQSGGGAGAAASTASTSGIAPGPGVAFGTATSSSSTSSSTSREESPSLGPMNRSRTTLMASSSSPMKHTLVVRAKTLAERMEGRG